MAYMCKYSNRECDACGLCREEIDNYPICAYCGERVIQERGLMLPDTGEYMCDSCIEINMKWLID